jgi:serine/threonine-protein phosphatase 6 regulatory ankyrin repeat subunit B
VSPLIQNGAVVDQPNDNWFTALQLAVRNGHTATIEVLLRKGAVVDRLSIDRKTALHFAAQHSWLEIVAYLLDNGADHALRDGGGLNSPSFSFEQWPSERCRGLARGRR